MRLPPEAEATPTRASGRCCLLASAGAAAGAAGTASAAAQACQPQQVQLQATPAQQQGQQLLLVAPHHQEEQPQLLQLPAGANLNGAQVMYIPAHYVLLQADNPAGPTAPQPPPARPTKPTRSGGCQAQARLANRRQQYMHCPRQQQRQGPAAGQYVHQATPPPPSYYAAPAALPSSRVFVGNLRCQITEVELGRLFAACGRVRSIKVRCCCSTWPACCALPCTGACW